MFSHTETYSNIDGSDLFSELKVLKEVLQINDNSPIDVINYIKRLESFSNVCIAFKILLTIPVVHDFPGPSSIDQALAQSATHNNYL